MEKEVEDVMKWRHKRYNAVEVFTAVLDKPEDKKDKSATIHRMLPSEYIRQMLFTTSERMNYLLKLRQKQELQPPFNNFESNSFKVTPNVVIFQRFVPGNIYKAQLTIRNVTKISRCLKVTYELDTVFSVELHASQGVVVAPGLAHVYDVKFFPDEKRDYGSELKFITDDEEFTISLIAIGPRSLLDFPDRIDVPATAVKIQSSKTILVRNVGDAVAIFSLRTDNPQFWIEPPKGMIEVEGTLQFTVNFLCEKSGSFGGTLFLEYESGETLHMKLQCSAVNCTIRTNRGSIRMEETYLGMSRSKTLTIHNRSEYIVKYQWMNFKDSEADNQRREEYKRMYEKVYNQELVRHVHLDHYDVCKPKVHELVCQRIYSDEIVLLEKEAFRYNHISFHLSPEEGEIWPQSSAHVTVLFKAIKVGEVSSTAYLEVTGREDRITLSLWGVGKGPVLRLNVITIDVENIYLCSVHNYEIIAANKGYIDGTLTYKEKSTDFGGTIKIAPSDLVLKPGEYKSFNLQFSSNRKGEFVERVDFVIKESLEIVTLHIKGCVVCPTLHFNKKSLDFGVTALGFSNRQEVCLHNSSLMPVKFTITMLDDGHQAPLTHEEFAKAEVKPSFPSNPREFEINPYEGVVSAQNFLKIQIIYTANLLRTGRSVIQVDMWDSDSDPLTLPISFCGGVASLLISPPEMNIRFCFVNFPYSRSLTIENKSSLDAYFYLPPQPVSENPLTVYSTSMHQGFLKPRQSKTIDVTIITRVLGGQKITISMLTMGEKQPVTSCVIVCNGQGPVVSVQSTHLNFGEVQVLHQKTMKLLLISDSPIPAQFKATLKKKRSLWNVIPNSGQLEPNKSMELEVKLYLYDVGKYSDEILLSIVNSRTISVYLTASGIGCSVVFDPDIFPVIDAGLLFSHQKSSFPITIKNLGTRYHQIIWSNISELPVRRGQAMSPISPKFQIEPFTIDIPPGGSGITYCKIQWEENETVLEDWYIYKQIQGQGKRELLGTTTLKATFTEPQIVFSKKELLFRFDMYPDGEKLQHTNELFVKNQSGLDLNVTLSVEVPFYLLNDEEESVQKLRIVLVDQATTRILVKFSPRMDLIDFYSRSYGSVLLFEYDEHPNQDKIKCDGFVNFPNLKFSLKDVTINCELGSSAERILTLTNDTPIPVVYKFSWMEESVDVKRHVYRTGQSTMNTPLKAGLKSRELSESLRSSKESLQNGEVRSAIGPTELLIPPANSPTSREAQLQKPEDADFLRQSALEITTKEVKLFLTSILETYLVKDTETLVLESISHEPRPLEYINQALDILPHEGLILPYTCQHVHFSFHGLDPVQIKTSALCEIIRGPTEIINVTATADTVQFSVDKCVIDVDQQLFCEPCSTSFTLTNESMVPLNYKIDSIDSLRSSIRRNHYQNYMLKIESNEGTLNPKLSKEFDITYQLTHIGYFNIQLNLQINHLAPLIIHVKGMSTFPQIYLPIPRTDIFPKHSPELGYTAIQSLTTEFIIKKSESLPKIGSRSILEEKGIPEQEELINGKWNVVSYHEIFPSVMDIEMAIERHLAMKFIEENPYVLTKHSTAKKKCTIPSLFSPEYIIDMGYLIVDTTVNYSTTLINYGPWNTEIKMQKPLKKDQLVDSGVTVQFKKQSNLTIGDIATIHVICHPARAKYTERQMEMKHTAYLEVTHGCNVPITVRGIVTYPYVTLNTKLLNFQDVVVGECLAMSFLIKNEGLVDSHWEVKLMGGEKKQEEVPFCVYYDSDIYPPGHSGVVRIYFKPRRTCHVEMKLNITVKMGTELQTITLIGRGIESKLCIRDSFISFSPVIPFTDIQERTLTIENISQHPVEFFWHHLDSLFVEENRIAKALCHYYQSEEILLPPRKLGERISSILVDFYRNLVDEMAHALKPSITKEDSVERDHKEPYEIEENESKGQDGYKKRLKLNTERNSSLPRSSVQRLILQRSISSQVGSQGKSSDRKSKERRFSKESTSSSDSVKTSCSPTTVFEELNVSVSIPLPADDSEETDRLLHCYIENLQKDADFRNKMKDPVKDIFDGIEVKSMKPPIDVTKPTKRVCIIFHGAPFTEYQETACRSAKALEIPVLCIDKAILEIIALGDSPCSIKLRQIVDASYQEFLAKYAEYRDVLNPQDVYQSEGSDVKDAKLKSVVPQSETLMISKDTHPKRAFRFPVESNTLEKLRNIPDNEQLESMEPLSRYEYKVETILLLQKIIPDGSHVVLTKDKASVKSSEKSTRKQQEDTFVMIELDLLKQALQERLSALDFERGFILQTLKNNFIKNEVSTLLTLLDIVGNVEYLLFVTFFNSAEIYNRKIEELGQLEKKRTSEDIANRIKDIDEMSLFDYNQLSEEDKRMYLDVILPDRKQEALKRKNNFSQRMAELRRNKIRHFLNTKSSKNKKLLEVSKNKLIEMSSQEGKSIISRAISSKKEDSERKLESGGSSKSKTVSKEMKEIVAEMNNYNTNLKTIEEVIINWNPIKKITLAIAKSNVPKSAKSKDNSPMETGREISSGTFHVWYVKSNDPWQSAIYNVIISQMKKNSVAKNVLLDEVIAEPDLRPKAYSILALKDLKSYKIQKTDTFKLALSNEIGPQHVENPIQDDIEVSDPIVRKEHTKKTRKRQQKTSSKADDIKSLNISTTESKDTNVFSSEASSDLLVAPRSILQPNETRTFKICYQPQIVGVHQYTYALSIVNGVTYNIDINGVADVPKLNMDPTFIFAKVEDTKTDDTNEPTYFLDTRTYDFGSLLVLKKDKRINRRDAEFRFHNSSAIDATVQFHLLENNQENFLIEPKVLFIAAGQYGVLKVSAAVAKLGTFIDRLFLCIRNNPQVEIIQLRSNGTKLDVELDGKQLSYDRVLLYRKEVRVSMIRNKSSVPIFWRIEADKPLESQITFSPSEGVIKARSEQAVEFCYYASRVGVIEKEAMTLKLFLNESQEDPIFTDVITISGETYDVAVDINHANPIDLKCVKVGFPTSACFTLRNRGNYEIKYVVMLEEDEKLTKVATDIKSLSLSEHLDIQSATGSIRPQETTTVNIVFTPKNEIILKESPILKCSLLDTNKQMTLVAEFPLTVSLIAYYTRFLLYPYPEICFDSLGICTRKIMYFNIKNTGKYSLYYSIDILPDKHPSVLYMSQITKEESKKRDVNEKTNIVSRRDKKSERSEKTITNRTDSSATFTLKVGPFIVTKTEGSIDAGGTDTIPIECYPEFVGSQEEEIIVIVPDSLPKNRLGKKIILSVNSCVPSIDFLNLDAIFQENYIVDCIQDFKCPREIGAHTVFSRQEKCLYFRHVCVQNTHTSSFKLYNRNVISADVEITLLLQSPTANDMKPNIFAVEPQIAHVLPTSYRRFNISFSPTLIGVYHGSLEVTVKLPAHLKDEKFTIKVIGESCVPQITFKEPLRPKRERAHLNFGRVHTDEITVKNFSFQNVGFVQAKIIVEIYEDPQSLFTFSAYPNTEHLLCVKNCDKDLSNDRRNMIRLMPEDVAQFEVKFHPKEIGKYEGEIRLFIVGNPYENLTLYLEGEGYMESVVLEGLELADAKSNMSVNQESNKKARKTSKQMLSSGSRTSIFPISLTYILNYGTCFVNKMCKRTFRIVNKSFDKCFRFQWGAHPNMVFEPFIGHLKRLTRKEIVATILATEPIVYTNIYLECIICEIKINDSSEEVVWDDRQTEVRWEEANNDTQARKVVEPTIEPDHEVVPGTTKCIHLLLGAVIAFSEYSCSVNEVNFEETLMFQTREHKFSLSNPGTVDTEYVWKIDMDEQYPMRLNKSSLYTSPRLKSPGNALSCFESSSSRSVSCQRNELRPCGNKDFYRIENKNPKWHPCKPISVSVTALEMRPRNCSCRSSDLFSSTAALTERSSDSWLESDNLPFVVSPEKVTLLPGKSVECILKFSPMEVFNYKAYLTCKIENLDPKLPELIIPITGKSLLPYCHFDVPESDYLSSNRRDPRLPGPINYMAEGNVLPEHTRVIEFKVIGVGRSYLKKFQMINPTTEDYYFSWKDQTFRSGEEVSNFCCIVTDGVAERGKRTDLAFTFFTENIGIYEFFWLFSIEKYKVECLFLFVVTVIEPSVYCLTIHLKMKPTVLNSIERDYVRIINDENFEIPFEILKDSLYCENHLQILTVTPMSGVLTPKLEQTLCIEYRPTVVGEFQFAVQCAVKMMKNPLTIFVSATSYDIQSSIVYHDKEGRTLKIHHDQENIIGLDKVTLKSPTTLKFEIINYGKMLFYYTWDLGVTPEIISKNIYDLTIPQKQGHISSDSRSFCYITLTIFKKTVIKDHTIIMKITRGPAYRIVLKASASKPSVVFSFNQYDFGPCYVQETNASLYQTELCIKNCGNETYILECKYEEQPHLSVNLEAIAEAFTPYSNINIPISFRPLEQVKYREILVFTINSTVERKVVVTGEGTTYKIRLVNLRHKSIDLGAVPIGKLITKKIPVINDGLIAVELKFAVMKSLPDYKLHQEKSQRCLTTVALEKIKSDQVRASISETKRSGTHDDTLQTNELNLYDILEIEPSKLVVLQPNQKIDVIVKFKPMRRMRPFTTTIASQTNSTILPLFVVNGTCINAEFRLNRNYLSFGTIVQGCTSEAKVLLSNTGDIGARFKWNTSKLLREFDIDPVSGYCSPGMDVNFVVRFQPTQQDKLIESVILLEIEKYEVLNLKISGGCCKLPKPLETVSFVANVRGEQMKTVNIINDTISSWKLKPEIIGEYFEVEEVLSIPSGKSIPCRITYTPLVMNTEDTLHKATMIIRLPDNKEPLLYILQGLSLSPEPLGKITHDFPAKTKYTELLPVYNWMNKQQRFDCKIENLEDIEQRRKVHISETPVYSFIGNNKIDVPANGQRDYHAVFHFYKESNYYFKITFTNNEGEYQFYEMQYKVTKPEIIDSIKLTTTIRSPVCYILKLDNPLKEQVIKYTAECQHPSVTIHDVPKDVSPLSNENIRIEYYPILSPEDNVVTLNVSCFELGNFPYELRLKALPVLPEKVTRVTAVLGSSITFPILINNYTKKHAVFTIEIDNDCFACQRNVEVPALKESSLNVIFEPCDTENVTANLKAISMTAGEFLFPIIGMYDLPKPQGPYTITSSTPISILFKNVFKTTKTFEFVLDAPDIFVIEKSSEDVDSKNIINIIVKLRDNREYENELTEDTYPETGKLVVYSTDPKISYINWVYYIRSSVE